MNIRIFFIRHQLFHLFFIGAAILSLSSCICDDEYSKECGGEKVQVIFTLAMDNRTGTRANGQWTQGDYEPSQAGDEYENEINGENLQVVLYNEQGNFLTNVTKLGFKQTDQSNVYQYVGVIDKTETTGKQKCKVMILANTSITNGEKWGNLTYTQSNTGIPLWGVKTADVDFSPNAINNLNKIYLLRAMAKVEVTLSDEVTDYSLSSVKLDRYNKTGYCLPNGYDTATDTQYLSVENCIRIPEQAAVTTPLEFTPAGNVTNRYYVYVPEFKNKGKNDNQQCKLNVALKPTAQDGGLQEKENEYELKFAEYISSSPSGKVWDIVRNHIYRFNITKVGIYSFELEYQVQEWSDKEDINIDYN